MRLGQLLRRRRDDNGAVAVEFALVFCFVLVPLMMGVLQYSWYFYASQVTSSAVRETARRLSVGDCLTDGAADAFAQNQSNFSSMEISFTPAEPDVGDVLEVTGEANGKIVGFLPLPNDGQLVRTVRVRVEDGTEDTSCT